VTDRAEVRRVDDRLGLAVERASLSARSLVTYARDHVTVRTPSRPDFRAGNTLDLVVPPAPDDLPRWADRFAETTGILGVPHVQIRWETPLPIDAPPAPSAPDADLAAASAALGFSLTPVTILTLDRLVAPAEAPVELVAVDAPSAVPGGAVDRRWHAATVLYRYESGDDPGTWREVDEGFVAWSVDVQRELTTDGRAQVWLAMRHGGPVGRLTLAHDRQGLAVIEDVIVHPVHRRLGIASALTHTAAIRHLEEHPGSRIGIGAEPGSPADHLYRRLGFRPHATVWTALRA
jgi:GNAT superfamily N-acetyltransferase